MTDNLAFSKFKSHEFKVVSEQLLKVFNTTRSEIESLYEALTDNFSKDGWPPHFVNRNFFKSQSEEFQKIYDSSPVIAIDLPSLFELDNGVNDKPTIVILGQDSKSNQDSEQISLGTPYGLHHKGSREILKSTKLYFDMVAALLKLGYRVYLTDIYKVWVCDPSHPYYGAKLPRLDQDKFMSVLKLEVTVMNPVAIVTWGKEPANSLNRIDFDIQKFHFPHPSGAANGAWKQLMNQSPTYENKLAYWSAEIAKVFPKSCS